MSNLVFPVASGLAFGWPVKKTPAYSTAVAPTVSGRGEVRVGLRPFPLWMFELDVTYLKGDYSLPSSAFQSLVGFYMAAMGKLDDWLYSDPYDNSVVANAFGTGDGTSTAFQLVRSLTYGGTDIVQNLNGSIAVYVAGALQSSSTYTVGSTGIITFQTAPASGAALTWTGSFYFRCRFSDDSLSSLQEDLYQFWSLNGLKFQSVIL